MPMRVTTVRFSEDHWKQLEHEFTREGVSAAQFIRDATMVRPAYAMGQRGDTGFEEALGRHEAAARCRSSRARGAAPAGAARRGRRRQGVRPPRRPPRDRAPRLGDHAVVRSPRAARREGAQRAGRAGFARGRRPPASRAVSAYRSRGPLSEGRRSALPFRQHAVASREPLLVEDTREHELLRDNPAIRDIGVIAYAGIPLIDADGHALGTLGVIDSRPRHWTTDQVQLLSDLATSVVTEIAFAKTATQATSRQ